MYRNSRLVFFHLFEMYVVKKHMDRAGPFILDIKFMVKLSIFFSVPRASKINSFRDIVLFEISYITVEISPYCKLAPLRSQISLN